MIKIKLCRLFSLAVAAILLASCTPEEKPSQLRVNGDRLDRSQKTIALDENFQVAMGQTIYVPVYSHIYHQDECSAIFNTLVCYFTPPCVNCAICGFNLSQAFETK